MAWAVEVVPIFLKKIGLAYWPKKISTFGHVEIAFRADTFGKYV